MPASFHHHHSPLDRRRLSLPLSLSHVELITTATDVVRDNDNYRVGRLTAGRGGDGPPPRPVVSAAVGNYHRRGKIARFLHRPVNN